MNNLTNPMFGISKQTYENRTDCWLLRLFYKEGVPSFVRTYAIGENENISLIHVKEVRDSVLKEAIATGNYPGFQSHIRHSRRNKSGINGVQLQYDTNKAPRFVFNSYANRNGKTICRTAGVIKWGWLEAFKRCVEWRRKQDILTHKYSLIPPIEELNFEKLLNNCIEGYMKVIPQLRGEVIK